MRYVLYFALFCLCTLSAGAQAGHTFTANSSCGVATVRQTVVINDDRGHSISLGQRPCTWQPPVKIGELAGTEYVSYGVDDVQNGHSVDQGYAVGTMKNGDRYFLHYKGTATMNGDSPEHLEGTWVFTGGTGSLKHLKGHGTYTAQPSSDGGMSFDVRGEYELSADGAYNSQQDLQQAREKSQRSYKSTNPLIREASSEVRAPGS